MKRHYLWMMALAAVLALAACRNKEQNTTGYDAYERPEKSNEVIRMKDYHYSASIKSGNAEYTYSVDRVPNDTLPVVTDEAGDRYADNAIRLRINKSGSQIFNRLFTKRTFKAYAGEGFISKAILEGMAFDKVVPQGLRFSASVSYPNSDMFVPFSITVAPDGSYVIAKDEVLDTETDMEVEDSSVIE